MTDPCYSQSNNFDFFLVDFTFATNIITVAFQFISDVEQQIEKNIGHQAI